VKSDVLGRSEDGIGIKSQTLYTGSVPEHTHSKTGNSEAFIQSLLHYCKCWGFLPTKPRVQKYFDHGPMK